MENKEHKAVVGMLTIDLLPMYKSGYLSYSYSAKYDVKSEYFYCGLIDEVGFPTLCDMMHFTPIYKLLHKYFWTDSQHKSN